MRKLPQLLLGTLACTSITQTALAHGFAGQRFFPATLATDDPFVSDELSLPTLSYRRLGADGDQPATKQTAASIDFTKRITSNFGLSFGASYLTLKSDDGTVRGFDNLAMGAKYQFLKDDANEAIASFGVDWDIGNSGAKRIGAEDFSTITPRSSSARGSATWAAMRGSSARWRSPVRWASAFPAARARRRSTRMATHRSSSIRTC